MGFLSKAVHDHEGHVTGLDPETFRDRNIGSLEATELFWISGMHERKAKMCALCDAAVALPCGFGTMDELFEMLTWAQIGLHTKPLFILNINGYYDCLMKIFNQMAQKGFIAPEHLSLFTTVDSLSELIDLIGSAIGLTQKE